MSSMRHDEWELFLSQRENGTGWQWPLNLAVALHIVLFGSAAVLQNMADRRPKFDLDNIVTVDLISMAESGPASTAKEVEPQPTIEQSPAEPAPELTPEQPVAKTIEVIRPHNAVKKAIAPPPVVVESKPEPPVASEKPLLQKTGEKVEVKAVESPKPETPVLKKTAEKVAVKPKQAIKKVAAKRETAPKEAVSLNPERQKTAPPIVNKAVSEKKEAQAAAMRQAEQIKIAEAKKKEAQAKAAKLAEEKKLVAEKARQAEQAKIAEAKKKEAQANVAQLAEEKKLVAEKARQAEQAKIAEAKKKEAQTKVAQLAAEKKATAEKAEKAAAARKKLAEQKQREALAEAKKVEQEAKKAKLAAENAREQLARALRQEAVVKSAVAALHTNGTGGNGRGAGSSPIALSRYAALLNGKISDCWKLPEMMTANKGLKTVVALTISKNGAIEDIKIEKKSDDALFDQSVLKALRSAEPLPKFPSLIQEAKLELRLNFTPNGLT